MPQVTLYLSDANRAALEEVLKVTGGRVSPVARELFLQGLRQERRRLGLEEIDLTQPTKSKSDAELLGIPTRHEAEKGRVRRMPAPVIRRADLEPQPNVLDEIYTKTFEAMKAADAVRDNAKATWTPPSPAMPPTVAPGA